MPAFRTRPKRIVPSSRSCTDSWELEREYCPHCGRLHAAVRVDARVAFCDGVLAHKPRWLIVEPPSELAAVTS